MESRDASQTIKKPQPKALVCLYAQRDELMYRELQKYLVLWQNQGHIYWADPASIEQADLILLLLSPDFFAARNCQRRMARAFEVRAEGGIPVIPILARRSNWQESACGALKALPDNDRPITEWRSKERAYENICLGLARLLPDLPALGIAPAERPRLFQARDLPKGYVPRPNVFDAIKRQILNRQGSQTTAITTALRGAGGFGKTTLALALCHDPEIQAAFPDGILWVELGENPRSSREVLNGILHALEPSLSRSVTPEEARENFRKALAERACLLVIDDVWQSSALEPLLEGGPHCKRLVTTRNDHVLPENAERIQVDTMEPAEAIALLWQGLPDNIQQTIPMAKLEVLARQLGYWPILLTLARGLIAERVHRGRMLEQAVESVARIYQDRGITAFDVGRATARNQAVQASIEVSLRHFKEFLPERYQARERYQELAVFPEGTNIPLTTLQIFWQATGRLSVEETEDLCLHLHRLSLLTDCDLDAGTIRLHDVLRSYLIQQAGSRLPSLHTRLLDAHQQEHGLTSWADLPESNRYLWQYLVWHLCWANRIDVLITTLTDLWYLTRKVQYGVTTLEADLQLVSTWPSAHAAFSLAISLYRNIRRIDYLLLQVSQVAEIGGALLSHLPTELITESQRRILESRLPRPFLVAWHPFPQQTSSALRRTLTRRTDQAPRYVISSYGSFIVSASDNKTLTVWDTATGTERFTISAHAGGVIGYAVSPDESFIVSGGRDSPLHGETIKDIIPSDYTWSVISPDGSFIILASDDGTLKLWDTAIGAERFTIPGHTGKFIQHAFSFDVGVYEISIRDCTIKLWDASTGTERFTIPGHSHYFRGCVVSPDSSFIVSTSEDNVLTVWDATTGTERFTISSLSSYFRGCVVSPNSSFIVSTSEDNVLTVWDATTGTERCALTGHTHEITKYTIGPDNSFIVSASRDGTLKLWDTTPEPKNFTISSHTDWSMGHTMSSDGNWIVSYDNNLLMVRDTVTGVTRRTFYGHANEITCCAMSPDGSFVVSASLSDRFEGELATFKVWNVATGAERFTITEWHSFQGCAVSPDGRWVVSASWSSTITVRDAVTGARRHVLYGYNPSISPDGNFLVSTSEETLIVWEVATGAKRFTLKGHTDTVTSCAISPDGRFIISTSKDWTLRMWDTIAGLCFLTFPIEGALYSCAFHPDGKHLRARGSQGVYFLRLVV